MSTHKPHPPKTPVAPLHDGELAHTLERRHVVMISIGGIIGAGLFVGSSAAIQEAGPAVLFSYILAGLLIFFIMRMLGELVIEKPEVGSFLNHIRRGVSHHVAFVLGWSYWLFWISAIAAEAIAGSKILYDYLPIPPIIMGPLLVLSMMATNLFSVKGYGEFEFWFALIKIITISIFIIFGLSALFHLFGYKAGKVSNLWEYNGFVPNGFIAVFAVIPTILFTVTGSEVATIAAAESDKPAENVAYACKTIIVRVVLFYIASIGVILCIVPWQKIVPGASPFLDALNTIGVPGSSTIMAFTILVAVLSCLNSSIYATSRTLFELAEYDDAPHWLVHTNHRGVPQMAIITASAIGIALSLISTISPTVFFSYLLSCAGSVVLAVYIMIAYAQIRVRTEMERKNQKPIFKMWLFPYLSWFTIACFVAVIIAMLVNVESRKQILLSALTIVILAICRFVMCLRNNGRTEEKAIE